MHIYTQTYFQILSTRGKWEGSGLGEDKARKEWGSGEGEWGEVSGVEVAAEVGEWRGGSAG